MAGFGKCIPCLSAPRRIPNIMYTCISFFTIKRIFIMHVVTVYFNISYVILSRLCEYRCNKIKETRDVNLTAAEVLNKIIRCKIISIKTQTLVFICIKHNYPISMSYFLNCLTKRIYSSKYSIIIINPV